MAANFNHKKQGCVANKGVGYAHPSTFFSFLSLLAVTSLLRSDYSPFVTMFPTS
ncbi:hypothetical protein VCRA2114E365_40083 [Vibrio crassostreae]|nr:hypothetical protein VCRA2116O31_30019 [Vibrio crassostreae]CAK2074786.1 hypothetical protein VCRA2117O40_30022 [Vibrio crassostreae]CAK2078451.1 hypothetical protein VCRA2116O27_30022 [Vibrio crassostreae]CAK2101211.1 hypothetical protein VCRA2116O30_410024 [Vibrio crassostreae]CAK2106057.1 hypothetical protein VCRA2113O20_400027 [Vibrio crassostreae]